SDVCSSDLGCRRQVGGGDGGGTHQRIRAVDPSRGQDRRPRRRTPRSRHVPAPPTPAAVPHLGPRNRTRPTPQVQCRHRRRRLLLRPPLALAERQQRKLQRPRPPIPPQRNRPQTTHPSRPRHHRTQTQRKATQTTRLGHTSRTIQHTRRGHRLNPRRNSVAKAGFPSRSTRHARHPSARFVACFPVLTPVPTTTSFSPPAVSPSAHPTTATSRGCSTWWEGRI